MAIGDRNIDDVVREQWKLVLDTVNVSDDDNFFEHGGDSLLAVELATRFESALGITFPIEALFLDGSLGAVRLAIVKAMDVSTSDVSANESNL